MLGYGPAVKFINAKNEEERWRIQGLAKAARDLERQIDLERANQIAHQVRLAIFGE
jgi:hypothetical protein